MADVATVDALGYVYSRSLRIQIRDVLHSYGCKPCPLEFVGCIVFIHIGVGFEVAYLYRVGKFEGQGCEISDEISRFFCVRKSVG